MISMCRVIHFELQSRAVATPSLLSMSCSEELSLRRRFDPSLKPSRNDGVNGAPNGISVPRRSLSKTHLKGSRPWASLSRNHRLTRAPSSTWRRRDRAKRARIGAFRAAARSKPYSWSVRIGSARAAGDPFPVLPERNPWAWMSDDNLDSDRHDRPKIASVSVTRLRRAAPDVDRRPAEHEAALCRNQGARPRN
jgi:hypothetical protein